MERNEIETKLTWDLSSLYQTQVDFEQDLTNAQALQSELRACKDHIAHTLDAFINFMEQLERLKCYLDNLVVYASMCTDVNPKDTQAQENLARATTLAQNCGIALTFVDQELIHHKDTIVTYLSDPRCTDFQYNMEELFRTIPHRLADDVEDILADVAQIANAPQKTFQSFRIEFPSVLADGKEAFLNGATFSTFLQHKDVHVRKDAFTKYLGEYERYQNVFMNTLSAHIQTQVFYAKTRNFPSALVASLFDDGADKSLFDKVLYMANEKYHQHLHDYYALRKDILHLEVQHVYDIQLDLVAEVSASYSIDDCFAIYDKALAPFGEEYLSLLHRAKEERWIDFMPSNGKRSGAYSWGTHTSNPYILTNFNGNYDSLSTLAHELGHSMHSYYSHKNNRPCNSGYRIFVAEVASTVNEILVNKYLLQTSTDKKYRAYILSSLLTQLVGTIYRQPMYAKFEATLHEMLERKEALSSQTITQLYFDLNTAYYGDSVIIDELQRYGAYYIPHFYYNFYVYKYTLGMSIALSFVKRILKGDVDDYLAFLSKGGSESPIDELMHAGVDPRADHVYDDAFAFFKETLDEFKALMEA